MLRLALSHVESRAVAEEVVQDAWLTVRTYLEQFRQTIHVRERLPEESLSPEAREALLTAFRGWSRL